jgi:hypothetical protein
MDSSQLRHELRHFSGFDQPFHHPLHRRVLYSPGAQFFFKNAGRGAYWMLDILATEPEILQGVEKHGFCVVILDVVDSKAVLTVARDYSAIEDEHGIDMGGTFGQIAYQRPIDYTDCPPGVWKFYFEGNMIMLPGER